MQKKIFPLFKGLTRPPMIMGIPLVPFILVGGGGLLFSLIFLRSILYAFSLVPIFLLMNILSKSDDKRFNSIFLGFRFRLFMITSRTNKSFFNNFHKYFETKKIFNNTLTLSPNTYMLKSKKIQPPIAGAMDYSAHIPYSSHINDSIIITVEGDYVATWECAGIPFETQSNEDLEENNNQIHSMLLTLNNSNKDISIYFHRTRSDYDLDYKSQFTNEIAEEMNHLYMDSLKRRELKTQKLFITIVYRPYSTTQKHLLNAKDKKNERSFHIVQFEEVIAQVESFLTIFKPRLLGLKEDDQRLAYSENISFYEFLLCGVFKKVLVGNTPFYNLIGNKRFFFVKNTLEVQSLDESPSMFSRCIEIKEYTDHSAVGILDELIRLKTNFVVTHSFSTVPKSEAQKAIKVQSGRLQSSNDDSVSQVEELKDALDDLASGRVGFGMHHFSCMVYASSIDQLRDMTNEAQRALTNKGFQVMLADIELPSAFFAQLPANFEYRPRLSMITSRNFANFIDMHSYVLGRENNNAWGQSVTVLPTPSKQLYHLSFHEEISNNDFGGEVLGHTILTGVSGSGKTATVNHAINQAQKFAHPSTFPKNKKKRFTVVYFDKDNGAKGNILGLGGRYISIKNGQPTGFNPFMVDDSESARDMQFNLIKSIVTKNNKIFNDRHAEDLNSAINSVMSLPKENRIFGISRLREALPIGSSDSEKENSVHFRLSQWVFSGKYGWVFDNEIDTFSLDDEIDNFGIDGTEFLDNKEVRGVITFYLMYRVMQLIDGRRLIMVFDEFWKWLSDPVFQEFVKDKLKTFRKLEAFLICATQSPSDCLDSDISAAIIEQCTTQIHLANQKADRTEYIGTPDKKGFNLTEKEFELVKGFIPSERKALIKTSKGSNVVEFDLSGLGKYLKLLSTGINDSKLIDDLIETHGKDSKVWLPFYLGDK